MTRAMAAPAYSLLLAGLACLGPAGSTQGADPVEDMFEALRQRRFRLVVRTFEQSSGIQEDANARFIVGHAWMGLHRPDQAEGFLIDARRGGVRDSPSLASPATLLARIRTFHRLRPPLALELPGKDRPAIRVFANRTPWSEPVLDAMPMLLGRGSEVFEEGLPAVDLYLFDYRRDFERAYYALFGRGMKHRWGIGTGTSGVALVCGHDGDGDPYRPPGSRGTLAAVLHECGHAWIHTYLGDDLPWEVPDWIDEGLADAIAEPYGEERFRRPVESVETPPTLEDLSLKLYQKDVHLRYALARHLVRDLLRSKGPRSIREVLDAARSTGDLGAALKKVSGMDPEVAYGAMLARLWEPEGD